MSRPCGGVCGPAHTDLLPYQGSVKFSMLCSAIIGFCGRSKSCTAPSAGLGTARGGLRAGVRTQLDCDYMTSSETSVFRFNLLNDNCSDPEMSTSHTYPIGTTQVLCCVTKTLRTLLQRLRNLLLDLHTGDTACSGSHEHVTSLFYVYFDLEIPLEPDHLCTPCPVLQGESY